MLELIRIDQYSFFPRTIQQWNNLNISNLCQLNLQEFKNYLNNHSLELCFNCISVLLLRGFAN